MRFKFTGDDGETFPTILHDEGAWVANHGDVIELDTDPGHARLEATDEPATIPGGRHADVEATHDDEPAQALVAPVAADPAVAGPPGALQTPTSAAGEAATTSNPDPDQE